MDKYQKTHNQYNSGKKNRLITLVALIMSLIVSSCGVVSGIFKAGMDFGIFIVIAILIVIVYIVMRFRKK
jgi:predicted small secreted protein